MKSSFDLFNNLIYRNPNSKNKDNVTEAVITDFARNEDSFYYKFYVTWLSIGVRFLIPVLLLIIFNSLLIRQVSTNEIFNCRIQNQFDLPNRKRKIS